MVPGQKRHDRSERPVRVGYLLRMYPRFSQTFIVNEILELERQGLDICIASMCKPSEGRFHELVSRVRADVAYLPESIWRHFGRTCGVHGPLMWRSPGEYLQAAATVLRYAGATIFDLVQAGYLLRWARHKGIGHVHAHFGTNEATVALLAKILGGLPYSMAVHAVDIFRDDVDPRLLARKVNSSCFTVANTEFGRRLIAEDTSGVDAEKVRLCYNGVDLERFRPRDGARKERTVLSVGRIVEKKGLVHLIRAIGRLRDKGLVLKCKIVGDGPEKRPLHDEIQRRALEAQVVLVGSLEHGRVRKLMQRYSCLVLPCIRAKDGNMDGIPNVLLEAMACACPCISTRLSGVPELIEDRVTGLSVEPGDEAALADAIETLLLDSALAARLASNGRRRIEQRFDLRKNGAVLHGWLRAAAEAGLQPGRPPARSSEAPELDGYSAASGAL